MRHRNRPAGVVAAIAVAVAGSVAGAPPKGTHGGFVSDFAAEKADLVSTGKNPYFRLEPGYTLVLENGDERLTITVTNATKLVDGVECRVVEELETKAGKVVEDSHNYFAASKRTGAVYYFGEDVGGAWLSGVNGAKFGMVMPGEPRVGLKHYQEQAPKVAMDRSEILSLTETVRTPAGVFKNCLKVLETTPLNPSEREFKYYAPGIGLVQEDRLKLVKHGGA